MWRSYRWQYTVRDKLNRIIHSLLHHLSVVAPPVYTISSNDKQTCLLQTLNPLSSSWLARFKPRRFAPEISFFVNDRRRIFIVWLYCASFLVKVSRIECRQVKEILCQFSPFARSIACCQTIYFLFRYHRAREWKSGITAGALSTGSARGWGYEMRASHSQNWTKNVKKPLWTGYETESI